MESKFVIFREEAETVVQRAVRDITREVTSAKRAAASRLMFQSSRMNASLSGSHNGMHSKVDEVDQNTNPQHHEMRSIPFPAMKSGTLSPQYHSRTYFSKGSFCVHAH